MQELYIKDNIILTANQLYNFVYSMHEHPISMTVKDDFVFFVFKKHTDTQLYQIISSQYQGFRMRTLNEILERIKSTWEILLNGLNREAMLQKYSLHLVELIETVDNTMPELRNIIYIPQPELDSRELGIKIRMAEDFINNTEKKFMEDVDKVVKEYGFIKHIINEDTNPNCFHRIKSSLNKNLIK